MRLATILVPFLVLAAGHAAKAEETQSQFEEAWNPITIESRQSVQCPGFDVLLRWTVGGAAPIFEMTEVVITLNGRDSVAAAPEVLEEITRNVLSRIAYDLSVNPRCGRGMILDISGKDVDLRRISMSQIVRLDGSHDSMVERRP